MNKFLKHLWLLIILVAVNASALNRVELSPQFFPNPLSDRAAAGARIYVGDPDLDPEIVANQKTVSALQENGSIVALTQPVITGSGGIPSYNGSPVTLLVDGAYSLKVETSTGTLLYYVPTNSVDAQELGQVENISDLREGNYQTPSDGDTIYVSCHTTKGDGGYGNFYWDSSSTESDNNGTIIAVSGIAVGRWIRVYEGKVNVLWFGCVRDGATDNYTAIQNAINYIASLNDQTSLTAWTDGISPVLYIPKGLYSVSNKLSVPGGTNDRSATLQIIGDGKYQTILRIPSGKTSVDLTSILDFPAINPPTTDSNSQWSIERIGFEGPSAYTTHGINGINMPKSSYATIRDCSFRYFDNAVVMRNWSNKIMLNDMTYCKTGIYITDADGIGGQTTINDNIIMFNIFGTCDYGVKTAKSIPINMITINHNQFDGLSYAAILTNGPIAHLIIEDNYLELQGRAGQAVISTNNTGGTASVNGAIVIHPTSNNQVSANGSIKRNFFINCNQTSSISLSGSPKLNIDDNTVSGTIAKFITLENPSGITLGPLPYTVQGAIKIRGSRRDTLGNVDAAKFIDFDNTLGDGTITHLVVDDESNPYLPKFAINDIRNGYQIGTATVGYSLGSDGMHEFTHATSDGTFVYRYTLTVTPNSPLSGAYIRFSGQSYGDTGTANWIATIVDGDTYTKTISASTAGAWGTCRQQVIYIPEQTSGSRTITIDIDRTGGAANAKLKGFCICDASYELGAEPILH